VSDEAQDPIDDELRQWISDCTGATALRIERRSGGASRAGYAVDATLPDGMVRELWLRMDTGHGPQSDTLYTVRREGAVYRALAGSAVRVAPLVAIHPKRDCFLAERLVGRNWFSEIRDPVEANATAAAFMGQLAALHAVDARSFDLPELGPVRTIREHVVEELGIWRAQYQGTGADEPVISLAFAWLEANVPADADWPVVLVQGDTGPGNFMYADGDVIAVMDWEMAHWGDLHDDFGWLCVRDTQERFGDLRDRIAEYEAAGGRAIDLDRLRWFRVLAQARCAVGTRRGLHARDARGEIANHVIYSTLHLRLLADALVDAMGLFADAPAPLVEVASTRGADDWLFDVALDDLRDVVVPALPRGFAQQRAKGLARLLKYLRSSARLREAAEVAERDELSVLLGIRVDDAAWGRTSLCRSLETGTVDATAAAEYCVRRCAREIEIARDAMGALADRRYAPID
jgi:aminoglycoside phosphotransferase (APT) family kinase protein